MPIPAIVSGVISVLGWIGIDIAIDRIFGDSATYVQGMDFPTFIGSYWLPLLLLLTIGTVCIWYAIPPNNGRSRRI